MAKKVKRESQDLSKGLIINEINQVNVDRSPKDVADLQDALRSAENVFYPNRTRMLDLFKRVDLDGHLTGIWGKRRGSTTKKKIVFLDASDKKVKAMDALIRSKKFRKLKRHIIDAKLWSLSGVQFLPGLTFDWEEIPRKHILIEKCMIKANQNDQTGFDYKEDPFVMVYGNKDDLGLMLKCSFYALIKAGNFSDWAQYSEIFGQPIRVVKYDAFDDKTRIQLKQVLDDSGSSLALMIPKQADFEIMDGKTSNGNGDLQKQLKDACNNEMSLIILGNVETSTNTDGGSRAKAEIQDEGEDDIKDDDLEDMLSDLNDAKFLKILASYAYPVEGGRFEVQEKADTNKIQRAATAVKSVRDAGTPVSDDTMYELTGLPKPENYKELKAEKEQKEAERESIRKQFNERLNKQKTANKRDLSDKPTLSLWRKFRTSLADFFDPAP